MIRLLLADDQELVRTGFRMVLDAQPDMTVIGEVGNGADAVATVTRSPQGYDVVLMDVRMPILDGIEATRRIVATEAPVKVLVLTTFDIDEYVFSALQAGASGFLLKDAGPDELLAAVRAVHNGDSVVAPSATKRLIDRFLPLLPVGPASTSAADRIATLTERELEVLTAVAQGLTNSEIASRLYLAEATVKTHIGHVLAKLGLRDRVHMVLVAYNAGLVKPDPYA
ncbi:MAG TPA: response regulator transcription factor [Propionibacteriaceae bacterium]|nr:response regulator transcription factor [Propionibacteriaceae bacterium]HPZ49048.1 response regulator transcription factor [Propionibacteriaceae bacterium]